MAFRIKRKSLVVALTLLALIMVSFKSKLSSLPDDPIIAALKEKFASFYLTNNYEKIYIQTNKPFYLPGDTIWYKAYVIDASTYTPTKQSGFLHLTLRNNEQPLARNQKIKLTDGIGSGHLVLPVKLKTGIYSIQATTNWQQNFESLIPVVSKSITVYNPETKISNIKEPDDLIAVSFYPEGGYLVNGLESKIGFKISDRTGKGLSISGKIINGSGQEIASFKGSEAGVGSFLFKPEKGNTYTSKIIMNGKTIETTLPISLETGIVMQVNSQSDSVYKVMVNKNSAAIIKTYLLLQTRGKIYYSGTADLNANQETIFTISKSDIPEGVAKLTLFNQDGKPECERLIYVSRKENLQIDIKSSASNYTPQEPVTLEITTKDKDGIPVQANISVAVTDQNALPAPSENILSNLYLSSEIAGPIENPAAYFTSTGLANKTELDNLLLTQGWRRFTWKQISENVSQGTTKKYLPELQLAFNAKAIDAEAKPIAGALTVLLFSTSGNTYATFTDNEGNINVPLPETEQSGSIIFRIIKDNKAINNARLVIPTTIANKNYSAASIVYNSTNTEFIYFQRAFDWFRIQKAFYPVLQKQPDLAGLATLPPTYSSNYSSPTSTFDLNKYITFTSVSELVKETIDPVILKNTKEGPEISVFSRQTKKNYLNSPLFIVDGYPTFDNKLILNLPIEVIEKLEVYNTLSDLKKFSQLGRDGVVALYTKPNTFNAAKIAETNLVFEGLSAGREFYKPKYLPNLNSSQPLFNNNPFWQATLITDFNGKVNITFPAGNHISTFKINVEGISIKGLPGLAEATYTVRTLK